jgi:hypothetical protein
MPSRSTMGRQPQGGRVQRNLIVLDPVAGGRRPWTFAVTSIAIHVVLITLLATVTFHYEIIDVGHREKMVPQRVAYVRVRPPQAVKTGDGSHPTAAPIPETPLPRPTRVVSPTVAPSVLPPLANPVSAGAASGVRRGPDGRPEGMAAGVTPISQTRASFSPPRR